MTSWEFLVQKDDDIKWYPATSSTLELEPGKYRILAKSSRFNSAVDVGISPPNQDKKCYQRRTNSQGLVMILPFTELTPESSWHICCHGDVFSEFLGERWTESLTIRVLSVTKQNPSKNSFPPRQTPVNNCKKAQGYLQQIQQLLKEKIKPCFSNSTAEKPKNINYHPLGIESLIDLSLEQDEFLINTGERIDLSGKIDTVNGQSDIALNAKLIYELIHPETEETLLKVDYPLSEEKLPYRFNHTLVIPDDIDEDFIVGELIIETATGYPINHSSFTIITNYYHSINCTIELMDTETKDSYTFDLEFAERINSKHSNLQLPEPKPHSQPFSFHFRKYGQVLPPKLKDDCVGTRSKRLKLPKFD